MTDRRKVLLVALVVALALLVFAIGSLGMVELAVIGVLLAAWLAAFLFWGSPRDKGAV